QLPGYHASANVQIPTLQIAVRTRINGSIGEGLDIGWKNKLLRRGRTLWLNYRNRSNGHPGGFFFEVFVGLDARHDAKDDQPHRTRDGGDDDPPLRTLSSRRVVRLKV